MKKNGETLLLMSIASILIYVVYKTNKSRDSFKEEADYYQMSNRFIEFFDKETIQEAYNKYAGYVDMGISPQSAFEMTIDEN